MPSVLETRRAETVKALADAVALRDRGRLALHAARQRVRELEIQLALIEELQRAEAAHG